MSTPLVSIVIPTYNRAKDLERALNSVLGQTYSNWEVLIVDNHSTDDTDKIISLLNDSRFKLFKIHNDGVIAASRNLGIKHAQGMYIAFLDSDDWWKAKKLEVSIEWLNKGADIVYHCLFLAKKNDQKFFFRKTYSRSLNSPVFDDLLFNGNCLINSSVVVRRELLQKVKGLTENRFFITMEDYDLWIRIAQCTERFLKIPDAYGFYWIGGGNASNPQQTIKTLKVFEIHYKNILSDRGDCVDWINYAKAKANYRLGMYGTANRLFLKVLSNKASVGVKIKSTVFILLGIAQLVISTGRV